MEYQHILVTNDPPVGILQINRPKALDALNAPLMKEMAHAAQTMDADPAIRCIVITGNERVFAAGADIQEMVDASAVELLYRNTLGFWDELYDISKPLMLLSVALLLAEVANSLCSAI